MSGVYTRSFRTLKDKTKDKKKLTRQEWDNMASSSEEGFYHALTLMIHADAENWEELKKKTKRRIFIF